MILAVYLILTTRATSFKLILWFCPVIQDDMCVGFDFSANNPSTSRCFIHTSSDDLETERYAGTEVNLHIRVPCQTGTATSNSSHIIFNIN